MTDQRFIVEMGMGNSLYSMNYTEAAARAIQDALRHSTIPLFDALGVDHTQMRVQVTIGAQDPDQVDCDALAQTLPRGQATVRAVFGGLNVANPDTGTTAVVCTAAVEAHLPYLGDRF
ncbi:MAG: Lin0512 family protein [Pseudomonadota bacterium]